MAYVTDIQLTVSAIGGGSVANKAEVKCKIIFTIPEVTADQEYLVRAQLWEQDEARDLFFMKANGFVARHQFLGESDDFVGTIRSTILRPNGNASVDVIMSHEWTFPDLDEISPSMERFFATVSVMPLLSLGDWRFSPIVDLDVG